MGSLEHTRRDYVSRQLLENDCPENPLTLAQTWLDEEQALNADFNAMALSTVGATGMPSSRIVLLRGLAADGLRFFTNYQSRKGEELIHQRQACALFFWPKSERQIRFEGVVTKLSKEESASYFASRPRESQLGAWASTQSREVRSREFIEEAIRDMRERFEGGEVPLPPFWGGFSLLPSRIEFWQGRANRLHDRIEYRTLNGAWHMARLWP